MICRICSILPVLSLLVAAGCAASHHAAKGWQADPAIIEGLNARLPDVVFEESKVPSYTLPDPLIAADGSKVHTVARWQERRDELLELFRSQMYGRVPATPVEVRFETISEDPHALNGAATQRRIAIHVSRDDRHYVYELTEFTPNSAKKPAPAFLLIDNRGVTTTHPATTQHGHADEFWPVEQLIARGYATASFYTWDVAPDDAKRFRDGVIRVFEGDPTTRPADAWGAISAWSWGASRAMDYLQTDPRIDAKHVAVVGHSRGGKTALWTAAQDERFAMAIANASGCGGSAIARRRFGETIRMINAHFPHWFCQNYKAYDERANDLPFDQHELVALVAPRPVYFTAMTEDLWADPRGSFLSLANASPVYSLFNVKKFPSDPMPPIGQQLIAGNRAWHIREGKHDLTPFEWTKFCDFADRMWK